MKDNVLIAWLILSFFWDCIVLSTVTYLVFWRDQSGWWYLFALGLVYQGTLVEVLKKRYDIEEN